MLTIGLFGFGCVGQGLWDVIHRTHGLRSQIARICVKDKHKSRPLPRNAFTFDRDDILNDDTINVVVELIDDAEAAFEIVSAAMRKGKAVVTANKKMVATRFRELLEIQQETQQPLLYEASTGGSIPIIRNLEEYYDNDLLSGVEGIVNGTTNYILSKLSANIEARYHDVLREAQQLGFAESDPSLDVDAWDAAYKTVVISAHAFGAVIHPDSVIRRGIATITPFDVAAARSHGCDIKLLSRSSLHNNQLIAWALPTFVPLTDMLSRVVNETNAIRLHGAFSDDQLLIGKGAGAHPTASAVLSDIAALKYSYRYEYKKLLLNDIPQFSTDISTRVYIRGNDNQLNSIEFSDVEIDHKANNNRYLIGETSIRALVESEPFNSSECFIAIA
ncbi:MAG: homoserine dehydrogenase [Ignavibacteria bacterium]|nr:homoserine dehydrogenase [Ignavibacteria bacterium]